MKLNKIGIITFHCSYNYGSALQAFALQTYLKKKGYKVKIIDFVMPGNFEQYRLFRTRFYKKHIKYFLADILYFFPNYKRKKSFEKFLKDYLVLTDKKYTNVMQMNELNEEFNGFICGSDQIWNIDCTRGIEPAFFLDFANQEKVKIAYAPSIAHAEFNIDVNEELRRQLLKFDAISIREESTLPVINSLIDNKIEVVLDPTLLLDKEDYDRLIENEDRSKYIFVYMLENNSMLLDYAEEISIKYGLTLVYISKKKQRAFSNGKNVYGTSPNDFIMYIKNAEFVITNSFHATVFSVLYEKKFCTFKTQKSSSRMVDLLEKIGLTDRVYNPNFNVDEDIQFEEVRNRLSKLRAKSTEFLERALDIENHHE